jgi:hypothetical protein
MIEGKVAGVLNTRELAINRGKQDGVALGMRFAVLDPSGVDITDPETLEPIGSVYRTKIRVQIIEVQPHMSVGRTYEKTLGVRGILDPSAFDVASLFRYDPPRLRTLKADDAVLQTITEAESYVKRGDPVRQIEDVELEASEDRAVSGPSTTQARLPTPSTNAPSQRKPRQRRAKAAPLALPPGTPVRPAEAPSASKKGQAE